MHDLDHRRKVSVMLAVMAAMLFAAANQTTIGTAMPKIITDLGGMEYFSWVFTAYILAASIPAVMIGKLSDIYGRKPLLLWGIGIFIVGSLLSGLADDIIELIIYRAVQGVGGGAIMATAFTAVGDLFPPRERGRWQGLLGATFGLASVFGPTLGGYIVDHWHWKWVFWVFTPLGLLAFGMIVVLFPRVPRREGQTIDYLGAALLTAVLVPLLLAFTWGGNLYPWADWHIIGLLLGSSLAFAAFIAVEQRASHPVLPLSLFSNSVFTLSNLIAFVMGASMFGSLMYMPLFLQGVMGISATASGTMMMPMTLSLVAASAVGGQIISRTGKYKALGFVGLATVAAGMYLLASLHSDSSHLVTVVYVTVVGVGLGLGMPVFTLTVQNAVDHGDLGVATATSQLFRQLGGTLGVALMGTVMTHRMHDAIGSKIREEVSPEQLATVPSELVARLDDPQLLLNPDKLHLAADHLDDGQMELFAHLIHAMREALSVGLSDVFIYAGGSMLLAVAMVLFLAEVPLRQTMR